MAKKTENPKPKVNSNAKTLWTIIIILIIGIAIALILKQATPQQSPQFSPGPVATKTTSSPSPSPAKITFIDVDGDDPETPSFVREYSKPQCEGSYGLERDQCDAGRRLVERVTGSLKGVCSDTKTSKIYDCFDYCTKVKFLPFGECDHINVYEGPRYGFVEASYCHCFDVG